MGVFQNNFLVWEFGLFELNMKTRRYIILTLCAVVGLVSCRKSAHLDALGLTVVPVWQDVADEGTKVEDLHLWFYSAADGKLVYESDFDSPEDLANTLFPFPAGKYTVVTAVNLQPSFRVDGAASSEQLLFISPAPATMPQHAFYGAVEFETRGIDDVSRVEVLVPRLMAEVAVELKGAPDGTLLDVKLTDAATAVYPARKSADGSFGMPEDESATIDFPRLSLSSESSRTELMRVMPTASGRDNSHFRLYLYLPNGTILESYIEAPVMLSAGKYLMTLYYSELRAFMHLSSCKINGWTEGWVYSGEILNPNE